MVKNDRQVDSYEIMITPKEQWELIKPVWRILVVALVFQFAGGLLSLFIGKYGHPFLDLWYGSAVSTFPGFIMGTLWHITATKNGIKDNLLVFSFIGIICLLLTSFSLIFPLEEMAMQMQISDR